jgi:hypothetical protein
MSRVVALLALLGLTLVSTLPTTAQEPDPPVVGSLVAQFPPTIGGSPVEIITFRGDEWLAGFSGSGGADAFLTYLAGLGVGPDAIASQVALASGVFVNSLGASVALTAIAVCPAGSFDLVANTLPLYGPVSEVPVEPPALGELVTGTATVEGSGRAIRAMARSNVVWLIDAAEPAVAEVMTLIPADGVACA